MDAIIFFSILWNSKKSFLSFIFNEGKWKLNFGRRNGKLNVVEFILLPFLEAKS